MSETVTATKLLPLDEQRLLDAAAKATALTDWGDDLSFRAGLGVLIESLREMLSAQLQEVASARILEILSTRLRLVDDARRHPEILREKIERPVVIIGMPRTGTTILYDLLSLDPAARSPREWEFVMPWPAPEAATFETDPRIAMLDAASAVLKASPDMQHMHRVDATAPAECNMLFIHHFSSPNFWAEWGIPRFVRWLCEVKPEGAYATHKRILQQLQWKGPRGRWTLKSPQHLLNIEGLLDTYPDACLIWTHREPMVAFSSLSSMICEFRRILGLDADPYRVGRSVMELWTTGLERMTASRKNDPRVNRCILDVSHRDTVKDKIAVVRRVHEHFGVPFSPAHEARLRSEAAARVSDRLGRHHHKPEDFGLHAAEVRERLPNYYSTFGDLLEAKG